jgi:DeoR/GlpR family transcriptional regulator of sugar metabolism
MREIARLVRIHSSVRVVDLAKLFHVSGETIRRDLELLDKEGIVRRVYGGAVDSQQESVSDYLERTLHRKEEKRAIGNRASQLVQDGDVLILDVGTTVSTFCEFLDQKKGLTVITPSLQVAQTMKTQGARVLVTGGELQDGEPYLIGQDAHEMLAQYCANRAFIGVGGLSFDVGMTDFNDQEVSLRKVIIERANQVIVLADSSKIGVRAFSVIGDISRIDVLVTDDRIHPDTKEALEAIGIEVLIAKLEAFGD